MDGEPTVEFLRAAKEQVLLIAQQTEKKFAIQHLI